MGGSYCAKGLNMPKFFVEPDYVQPPNIEITGTDVKHIKSVLRLKVGDMIEVADGTGKEYQAEIGSINSDSVFAVIKETFLTQKEPPLDVYLLQGLPKGEKMEFIIQKCTEIGIKKIIPISTERSVVQLNKEKASKRCERWQRIATEAAKQCQRSIIPEVGLLGNLKQILETLPPDTIIIMPWESEKTKGMKETLEGLKLTGPIAILIGPEGGFTEQEVNLAFEYGAKIVSLGPRILRTETAGLVSLTMVLYHLGDLGGCFSD